MYNVILTEHTDDDQEKTTQKVYEYHGAVLVVGNAIAWGGIDVFVFDISTGKTIFRYDSESQVVKAVAGDQYGQAVKQYLDNL